MKLESTMYVVELRLKDLADAMLVRLDCAAYGEDRAVADAEKHEQRVRERAEKAVALHMEDPEVCMDCLSHKMKWVTRPLYYAGIRDRWLTWCANTVGTDIAPCTKDGGCRPGALTDFVFDALEVYDTAVLAADDFDELDEFEKYAIHCQDATLGRARKALAAGVPQEDDATRESLRDELRTLMLENADWMKLRVHRRLFDVVNDPRVIDDVVDRIFDTGGDTDESGHFSRKRACPDSPVADRHESACAKQVKVQ